MRQVKARHAVRAIALFLSLTAALSGCASIRSWDEVRGKVLDAETKEPIEGVVVVYHWKGTASSFVVSRDQCYHVESAVTDADGVFVVPAWKESFRNRQHRYLDPKWYSMKLAYKPGYRVSELSYKEQALRQNLYYLEKYEAKTREERLWYLLDVIRGSECGNPENMRRALQRIYLAVYDQASALASDARHKEIIDEIRYTIVRILGYSEYPPTEEAINKFFGDHTE